MRVWLAGLIGAMLVLAGCGDREGNGMTLQERSEERAAETRGYIDDLAERMGATGIEVLIDDAANCDPVDTESGLLHSYTLGFTLDEGGIDRLTGEVADYFESQGWTVRRDAPNLDSGQYSVRFLRGTFSIGGAVSSKTGNARASGSGGCVE